MTKSIFSPEPEGIILDVINQPIIVSLLGQNAVLVLVQLQILGLEVPLLIQDAILPGLHDSNLFIKERNHSLFISFPLSMLNLHSPLPATKTIMRPGHMIKPRILSQIVIQSLLSLLLNPGSLNL